MDGTTVEYIVINTAGGAQVPIYVYEFSANNANGIYNATKYEDENDAVQSADLLNQMQELQGGAQSFEIRKVTTIVEEVEVNE